MQGIINFWLTFPCFVVFHSVFLYMCVCVGVCIHAIVRMYDCEEMDP